MGFGMGGDEGLGTGDWAVLAFLCEKPAHGFKAAAAFAHDGDLGRVWTLQRPQVYRILERLQERGLAASTRVEASDAGPPRTVLEPTPEGRAAAARWLRAPVDRLRLGRTDLVLKLVFLARGGSDPRPLLRAQRAVYQEVLERYEARLAAAEGAERIPLAWRVEAARGALAFLERQTSQAGGDG